MPDIERRTAMLSRARALRTDAEHLIARCKDAGAKSLVEQMVLHHLDDVEGFFLSEPNSRPSLATYENMWLDNAEMVLGWGEQSFASLLRQFDAYGGPENVQVIG